MLLSRFMQKSVPTLSQHATIEFLSKQPITDA